MKYLHYTTYCSGRAGLSNGIMSIEIGVILAFLMDRVLLLEGNRTPPANIVHYPGIISNRHPTKITDLLDLPVPWLNAEEIHIQDLDSQEFSQHPLMKSVFYFPASLDLTTEDFHQFARGRKRFLTYTNDHQDATVLTMPGGPEVGPQKYKMANLSLYSYYYYFDDPTRTAVHRLLRCLKPKQPYLDFAQKIANDLGPFNGVHMRRGDFKHTFGVTTLERTPQEALSIMDHHFSKNDRLVILTDEMHDPFFQDIQAVYRDNVFLDHFILENHREEFLDLPCHDSLALAFLSQLVASESKDFIGSMNSTFTAIIQRYRGNKGKKESFKFLWNELPDEGVELERGRHSKSHCVPMNHGIMVEEFQGPYSWNRVNQRINPAWMREWPESFLSHPEIKQVQSPPMPIHNLYSLQNGEAHSPSQASQSEKFSQLAAFHGMVLTKNDQAWVFIGVPCQEQDAFMKGLQSEGWNTLARDHVTLNLETGEMAVSPHHDTHQPCSMGKIVLLHLSPSTPQLANASPALAVGELLSYCIDLKDDNDPLIQSLCKFVERETISRLTFAKPEDGIRLVIEAHNLKQVNTTPQKERMLTRPVHLNLEVNATDTTNPQISPIVLSTRAEGILPSPYIQIDHFLTSYEKNQLLAFALQHRADFVAGRIDSTAAGVHIDSSYRNNLMLPLFQHSEFSERFFHRVRAHLGDILPTFQIPATIVNHLDGQLSATNNGGYYGLHNDNGSRGTASREITFVYYFYRDPKPFAGGTLVLYDTKVKRRHSTRADSFQTIEPRNNSIVFFLSGCMHEVLPVRCPSQDFGHSRFAVNGWVLRQRMTAPITIPDSIQTWAHAIG